VMAIICTRKEGKRVKKNYRFIRSIIALICPGIEGYVGFSGLQGASAITTGTPRLLQGVPQALTGPNVLYYPNL